MTSSSIRALALVARRDIWRHRLRSALVVALIALPVAAMVAATAIYRTTQVAPDREAVAQMGRADLSAFSTTPGALALHLPKDSVIEPMISTDGQIVVPGGRPSVTIRALAVDGLAAGILTVVDGRAPKGAGEAAITAPVATLADVSIGDRLELGDGRTVTVVGLVENPMFLADPSVVVDPASAGIDPELATWLIGLPPGADPEAIVAAMTDPDTGSQDIPIQSRESGRIARIGDDSGSSSILVLGALALVEAALIASAAFAVSIRRRQRELGLLAATGATPRQLAGSVLAEGAILGIVACIAGVAIGIAGAFALTPWLDDLTQRRNPPLVVDVVGLIGPVAIGFLAAMIAAIVPARTVARVPVLLALSGRRPPQTPARRTLWIGLVGIALAAAMTVVGATMEDAGGSTASIVLLIGGAVLSTLGFGACGPWLLERLDTLTSRLPLAGRIALRDTARGRSRSSPIVTAILAGCAAAIALGAWQASRDEENLRGWIPGLYPDQLAISGPVTAATQAGEALRGEAGVVDGALMDYLGYDDPNVLIEFQLPDATDDDGKLINMRDQCTNCNPGFDPLQVYRPAPATPDILRMAHAESAAADLAQGYAIVLSYRAATATKLEIVLYRDPNNPAGVERVTLPVRLLHVPVPGGRLPDLFLPDSAIRQLGLVIPEQTGQSEPPPYVVRYDHPVTDADLAHAQEIASRYPSTFAVVDTPPERQGAEFRLVIMALVLLFAVSVTGIAIALGEAETRPEQRSLLAIGADPWLRRRIAGARAAVMALLAGILAVPAGLLPIWGIFVSRGSPIAVPTIEIAGAVLVLPVLAVLSSWLLSRPIPDWNAFRNVRPGD
jgi:putative ABC transport system permease protein